MSSVSSEVVVVGAGPAGSAAAARAARSGREVLVIDAEEFPRDKACGDGLTPRAVAELRLLGLGDWLDGRIRHHGLRLTGFGTSVEVPWQAPSFPAASSAVPRTELDDRIRKAAESAGAAMLLGRKAVSTERDSGGRVSAVVLADGRTVGCRWLIVADGARSPLGRTLGRQWHQDTVYGVAARGYLASPRADEPWISSDLELRSPAGGAGSRAGAGGAGSRAGAGGAGSRAGAGGAGSRTGAGGVLPGYGWIFPLGNGEVNIGVGALATAKRPADVALRPLIRHYTDLKRREWGFEGPPRAVASALLPMGGAVSGVAGPNWLLIGDAAACVNPLNGEGIDYGLETGRLAADLIGADGLTGAWPALLQEHYGRGFSVARRLGLLLTLPRFLPIAGPVGMRSARLMQIAVRVMGNLVTEDDADWVARMWRAAGSGSRRLDHRQPFG